MKSKLSVSQANSKENFKFFRKPPDQQVQLSD